MLGPAQPSASSRDVVADAAAAPADDVRGRLGTSAAGLTADEARRRLAEYGPNTVEAETRSLASIVLEQFRSGITLLLIGAGILTLITGDVVDASVIVGLVLLNVALSVFQEYRAERTLEALRALLPTDVAVIRDGRRMGVPAANLVPGDLVEVAAGTQVPADLRLLEADRIEADQSTLTGESVPRSEGPEPVATGIPPADWSDILFAGTTVVAGHGLGVVLATGERTSFGATATLAARTHAVSDFEVNLARFGGALLRFGLVLSGGVFVVNALLGRGVLESLTLALALALGVVPEGEGFNNPNQAAQRYSWIRPLSTSLRSTTVRAVSRTCGVRLPAGTARLNPRCGLSAT